MNVIQVKKCNLQHLLREHELCWWDDHWQGWRVWWPGASGDDCWHCWAQWSCVLHPSSLSSSTQVWCGGENCQEKTSHWTNSYQTKQGTLQAIAWLDFYMFGFQGLRSFDSPRENRVVLDFGSSSLVSSAVEWQQNFTVKNIFIYKNIYFILDKFGGHINHAWEWPAEHCHCLNLDHQSHCPCQSWEPEPQVCLAWQTLLILSLVHHMTLAHTTAWRHSV